MRIVLVAISLAALGCGPNANEDICRKDAQRWGKCVGELTESADYGDHVKRELETQISRCVNDDKEVAIARACMSAPTCEAWTECWSRRGQPLPAPAR